MLSIADVVASVIFNMPYFTVVGAIGIIAVEGKSVFENIRQEDKNVEEVQKVLLKFFENKEDIKAFISFLNSNTSENDIPGIKK